MEIIGKPTGCEFVLLPAAEPAEAALAAPHGLE